jgi:restriction system protein
LVILGLAVVVAAENTALEGAFGPQRLPDAHAVLVLLLAIEAVPALKILSRVVRLGRSLLIERRTRVKTLSDLLALSPTDFERAACQLLRDLGYKDVRRTGGAGDLAADVVCRSLQGQSVVVQCKRYAPSQRIGSPVIQTFIGMAHVHHQADRAILITTSGYTRAAIELA